MVRLAYFLCCFNKKFYGIAEEASPQNMVNELNKLKDVTQANIIADIPYEPGSKEYYAEMSQKISDVNQRMKLIVISPYFFIFS